jgi:SAM-dependent methyltransferase
LNCRHCETKLQHIFLDLGFAPPSNAYLSPYDLNAPETYFPLKIYVCSECWLVQTEDFSCADELFTKDYAYFSSISSSFLTHASNYCEMITKRLELNSESFVIEIASNDGYLLKNFVAEGIPCVGVEPTDSTAAAAEALGIPVIREFFGKRFAQQQFELKKADLILGNNVFAHVPDINDFTSGLKDALKIGGTITLEFPHLLSLVRLNQFDTVYHEHYSYLSLQSVQLIFERVGLRVFDVEELHTHGGSLRIYGCHATDDRANSLNVTAILEAELNGGLQSLQTYLDFQAKAEKVKDDLLHFLIEKKRQGEKVIAYGAAAKGNTLLNYAGVKPDLLEFVCDAAPSKQGKFMPGSHIPILSPDKLAQHTPDYVLVLPWNITEEVMQQNADLRKSGTKFIVAVPSLKIL